MPLFFFVSGFFSKNEKNAARLFSELIVPVLPFELAYFLLHWILRMENSHQFLTPVFAYWYVFTLFGCRVLLPVFKSVRGILPLSIAVALLIGFNTEIGEYMTLERFFCMLPFFMAGYCTDAAKIQKMQQVKKWMGAAALLITAAALAFYMRFVFNPNAVCTAASDGNFIGVCACRVCRNGDFVERMACRDLSKTACFLQKMFFTRICVKGFKPWL